MREILYILQTRAPKKGAHLFHAAMADIQSHPPPPKRPKLHQNGDEPDGQGDKKRIPSPQSGICAFWLEKKSRYCKLTVRAGNKFCGEHQPVDDVPLVSGETRGKMERVRCPVDGTHTVAIKNLKRHIARCNASKKNDDVEAQPFFRKGVNRTSCGESDSTSLWILRHRMPLK